MNAAKHSTIDAVVDWEKEREEVHTRVRAIASMLHLLLGDLESGLDETRGRIDRNSVTLMFQRNGIDATMWLVGEVWNRSVDLRDYLDELERIADSIREAGERRAAA